jgi:ABC-2 type transport system permease protein
MTTVLLHSWYMTWRLLRNLSRQPLYIAFTLLQPMIYLLFFSQLFKRIVEIPGFGVESYITFLTPGIVLMSAFFGPVWGGMGVIVDIDRGVMDRFLVSPISRVALIAGRLIQLVIVTVVQALVLILVGLLLGARFPSGLLGVIVLVVCAVLLAVPFGALSSGMALLARREESVIAAANFIQLPLTFLSSVFMAQNLMPTWMQDIARFNPLNWAVQAGRAALNGAIDWGVVLSNDGYLLALGILCTWLSMRAFHIYQRSI